MLGEVPRPLQSHGAVAGSVLPLGREVSLGQGRWLSFFKDSSQRGMPAEGCLQAAPTDTEEVSCSMPKRDLSGIAPHFP